MTTKATFCQLPTTCLIYCQPCTCNRLGLRLLTWLKLRQAIQHWWLVRPWNISVLKRCLSWSKFVNTHVYHSRQWINYTHSYDCVTACSVLILPVSLSFFLFLLFLEKLSSIDGVMKYRGGLVWRYFRDGILSSVMIPRITRLEHHQQMWHQVYASPVLLQVLGVGTYTGGGDGQTPSPWLPPKFLNSKFKVCTVLQCTVYIFSEDI